MYLDGEARFDRLFLFMWNHSRKRCNETVKSMRLQKRLRIRSLSFFENGSIIRWYTKIIYVSVSGVSVSEEPVPRQLNSHLLLTLVVRGKLYLILRILEWKQIGKHCSRLLYVKYAIRKSIILAQILTLTAVLCWV